jgi:hypothetical protein
MLNKLVILATLAATSSLAAADVNDYVGTGLMAGADLGVDGQLNVEGGHRIDGGKWLHLVAASGWAGDDQGGGAIHQARAGIEGRSCTAPRGILCAFAGADLGYQSYTWHADAYHMSPDEPHHDAIGVLRVGGDIGGQHVRVKTGLETYTVLAGSTNHAAALMGINLTLGLAYQW